MSSVDYKVYNGTVAGGIARHRGRAASVHTVKDSDGWRPPTAYWAYDFVETAMEGIGSWPTYTYGRTQVGNNAPVVCRKALPPGITLSTYRPVFADLGSQAITAALADLGSATAELGVELKEAQKTADFIGEQLQGVWKLAKAVKAGKVPKEWRKAWKAWRGDIPRSFNQTFSQRWLEYRYAWSPMILGVYDSLDLLDKQSKRPQLHTVRKRVVSEVLTESSFDTFHGGYFTFAVTELTRMIERTSAYAVLTFEPKESMWIALNDAGVLNPASVWWETVPFSFVADWFVRVGDFLNAQQALRLFRLKGGTLTHRHEWKTEKRTNLRLLAGQEYCESPNFPLVEAGGHSFNRAVVGADILTPTLMWGTGLNCTRSLDAISLLTSMFGGKTSRALRV